MGEYGQPSLYHLIKASQSGDRDSLFKIINKFKPLISKLNRKLGYEEAETDLTILFIEMIKSLKLEKFNELSEGQLVNYIYNSLNNKCIDLFRKYVLKPTKELGLNLDVLQVDIDMDTKIFVDQLLSLNVLTNNQKQILKHSYISEYSDVEIGKMFNISRQAVNKAKNRGIHAIRTYLDLS